MGYSEAEQLYKKENDERICKQAYVKSLIEKCSDVSEVENETQRIMALVNMFVDFTYNKVQTVSGVETSQKGEVLDWVKIAQKESLPEPNDINIKILNIISEKCGLLRTDILTGIYKNYGKYPTSEKSVETIVNKLNCV